MGKPFSTFKAQASAASIELLEQRRLMSLTLLGPATDVPGEVGSPLLAVAGNGMFVIARDAQDASGTSHGLVLNRFSAAGEQIGSPITVAAGASILYASVAMDGQGDVGVAWTQTDSSGNQSIHLETISHDGVAKAPLTVASDLYVYAPSISGSSNGIFFLGWLQTNAGVAELNVQVHAFHADETSVAPTFTVIATAGDIDLGISKMTLSAKPDGSGATFAVAESFEGANDAIAFGRTSQTALVGTLSEIRGDFDDDNPSIAENNDGSFEIGYTTSATVGGTGGDAVALAIVLQRFDATGAAEGDLITLRSASEDADIPQDIFHTPTGYVSVDAKADGGFIVAYSRLLRADGELSTTPISVQNFDAQGVADSDGPLAVATNSDNQQIGIDENGNAVVAFSSLDGTALQFARVSTTTDFATVQNSVLSVIGSADDDTISIAVSGSDLTVTRGTLTRTFTASTVTGIHVDGLEGNDTITNGTAIPSTLEGGDGDDTLFGGSSADRLDGGAGSDSLWGEGGNDRLAGDDGHDYLFGNGGNDKIYGGLQPDFIRGNDGHDHLYGNGGNDVIYGGASNDSLYGQGGNDQLFGEGGDDHLYSDYDSGNSTLHGGAGNDTFVTKNNLADQLFGDGGHDSAAADNIDLLTSIEATQG